jgi:cbb3-type cytochrome oxidase subunit 1
MPKLARMYFKVAVVFFLIGILMGLQMSISGNHSVIGAHAHTNLLGWVTSAIFGAFYALNPAKAESRLASVQFWIYVCSVGVMVPSLYIFYMGYSAIEPLLAVSSLTALGAVLIFAFIVFSPEKRETQLRPMPAK